MIGRDPPTPSPGGRLANVVMQVDAELFFSPHSVEEHVALTGRQAGEGGGGEAPTPLQQKNPPVLSCIKWCFVEHVNCDRDCVGAASSLQNITDYRFPVLIVAPFLFLIVDFESVKSVNDYFHTDIV